MAIKALKQNVSICEIQKYIYQWKTVNKRSYCKFKLLDSSNAGLYERKRYLSTLQFLLH